MNESAGFTAEENDEWRASVRVMCRCKLTACTILHALLDTAAYGARKRWLASANTWMSAANDGQIV